MKIGDWFEKSLGDGSGSGETAAMSAAVMNAASTVVSAWQMSASASQAFEKSRALPGDKPSGFDNLKILQTNNSDFDIQMMLPCIVSPCFDVLRRKLQYVFSSEHAFFLRVPFPM